VIPVSGGSERQDRRGHPKVVAVDFRLPRRVSVSGRSGFLRQLERLNVGVVIALALCVAIWMVIVGFLRGYVF